MMFNWLRLFFPRPATSARRRHRSVGRKLISRRRPQLEHLEDRTLLAFDLTVVAGAGLTNATDVGGVITATGPGATVGVTHILNDLVSNNENVTLSSGAGGTGTGDITWSAGNNLDFKGMTAAHSLTITTDPSSTNVPLPSTRRSWTAPRWPQRSTSR
jgi:hypothetical protein